MTMLLLDVWFAVAPLTCDSQTSASRGLPHFRDYPAANGFDSPLAQPIFATVEQQQYASQIRDGLSKGSGVWNGSWKHPIRRKGPNFAGHFVVIRWGCGSNCLMMAVVDAKTGVVYPPPLSGVGSELYVPMDPSGEHQIEFQPDSTLIILRTACKDFKRRETCGTYWFDWKGNDFTLLKFTAVAPFQKSIH